MRIVKSPEERKSEILDLAAELFVTKGYSKTTIMDIINGVGVAKGTFYYYFKSKEEVLDAIIMQVVEKDTAEAKKIASAPDISALDKLSQILFGQKAQEGGTKEKMLEQFQQPNNVEMQQKGLRQAVLHLSPILETVVEQGISEGSFHTEYPKESMELLLISGQIIFDESWFQWKPEEAIEKAKAFIGIMETVLGGKKGSFDYMVEILLKK